MKRTDSIAISIAIAVIFLVSAFLILRSGHLHEDAYILFQYSKNLSTGKGIVFDQVSGPTEGATDFLWMAILAVFNRLGIDLGSAAAILNSLGAGVISWVIIKLRCRFDLITLSGILLALVSGGTAAALGGFSTLAYGALFALFALNVYEKNYFRIALLALLLSLFRPDGLLLALGGVIITLAYAEPEDKKRLTKQIAPILIIGFCYFIWRYFYFGLILPLPLLVKVQIDQPLEGLKPSFDALKNYTPLFLPLVFLTINKSFRQVNWRAYLAVGFGPLLLLVALLFANQSQNIGYRFQFPIILSAIFIFLISSRDSNKLKNFCLLLPLLGILSGGQLIRWEVLYLTNNDYINSFPQFLKRADLNLKSLAVTEAGRFPFWYDADQMIDLVGLNSAKVVKNGATETLEEAQPDLIFVHHAGRYDTSRLDSNLPFLESNTDSINLKSDYTGKNPVKLAPESALKYARAKGYSAIFVRYGESDKNFNHVYFLSPRVNKYKFLLALNNSFKAHLTYYNSF
jgi:hypothetical protein